MVCGSVVDGFNKTHQKDTTEKKQFLIETRFVSLLLKELLLFQEETSYSHRPIQRSCQLKEYDYIMHALNKVQS